MEEDFQINSNSIHVTDQGSTNHCSAWTQRFGLVHETGQQTWIVKSADQAVDPWLRHTFWSVVFGNSTGFAVASYTCQQYKVQRYLSCKSLKEAQKCIYLAAFGIMAICVAGKFFTDCRPVWVESFESVRPWLNINRWRPFQVNWLGIAVLHIFNIAIHGKMVG